MQPYMNPYMDQVIQQQQAEIERQRQMQLNQIGAQAQAAGAFGGSRHGVAESLANRDYARMLNDSTSKMRHQGWNTAAQLRGQDMDRSLGAANQLAALARSEYGMGRQINQDLAAQGQQRQQMVQKLLDLARGQFGEYTGTPERRMGALTSLLHGVPPEQREKRSRSSDLLAGLGFGATLFSDRRLKSRLMRLWKVRVRDHLVQVYSWIWKREALNLGAGGQPGIGFIAQELLGVAPDAVSIGADGYYRVDYVRIIWT